jgi:uncharacterized membrane protein YbhN (UPF0104 family)
VEETFWTLLRDLPHWEFELFVSLVFLVMESLIFWPLVRKFLHHHKSDDDSIASLREEVRALRLELTTLKERHSYAWKNQE